MRWIATLFFFCFCCFATLRGRVSSSADAISWGHSLSGNQTIVSAGGLFELGFLELGSSRNAYIGIWYKNRPQRTVVWVANRETPVNNTSLSELTIWESGNLVLLNQFKTRVWSSSMASIPSKNTTAVLLDNGNFILRDVYNSSIVYWQSFDHPAGTWLPGARVGRSEITGEYITLNSWKSPEDPAPGPYSFSLDPTPGVSQILQKWNTSVYFSSGKWSAQGQFFNGMYITFTFEETEKYITFTYSFPDNKDMTRFVMDSSGQGKQLGWVNNGSEILAWSQPRLPCDVPFFCGAFSVCDDQSAVPCACLPGFDPMSMKDWNSNYFNGGCRRRTPLQCRSSNGSADGFVPLSDMLLPAKSEYIEASSPKDCEFPCLMNCSCTAYSYNGSGCSLWNGELSNLQRASENVSMVGVIYLRLTASELPPPSSKGEKNMAPSVVICIVLGSLVLVGIPLLLFWRLSRRQETGVCSRVDDNALLLFSYRDLKHYTRKFSEELGRGGFGSVFKGVLPGSTVIAVKKLDGHRQGEKQFRSEIRSLGTIKHLNLVRLLGFCMEGNKRLLVYEYMFNGSLDSLLFRNDTKVLNWAKRQAIAVGAARGLAYLHEECRDCILHCDVKPENILLDENFCPKVADFGMAKLLGRDFSQVLTTVKGTIGYLAPEWLSGQTITTKVDVYSYGMMLLEIISGKRNASRNQVFFPVWAAEQVSEGECLSLLDDRLKDDVNVEELERFCRVACWCIQDEGRCRPSMGQIVQILEGVVDVGVPPVPAFLQNLYSSLSEGYS